VARTATHRTYATRLPAAERRRQLLQAAGRVLAHGGYPALTMEAVARQAGVTKPVVYAAFANREDLMARLLEAEGQRVVSEITAAISPPPGQHTSDDLDEFMVAGLRRVLELVRRRPQRYR
jgi:AcrR family transcriptional regulator